MNFQREDREGVAPTRELPVERQQVGQKQKGGRPQNCKVQARTLWSNRLAHPRETVPSLLPGGAQQGAEWLRQP